MKRVMVGVILIVCLAAGIAIYIHQTTVSVRVDRTKLGTIKDYVQVRCVSDLDNKAKVFCRVPAITRAVYVDVGDQVSKGTPLLEFEKEDISIARAQVDDCRIAVAASQNNLAHSEYLAGNIRSLYAAGGVSEQELKDAAHAVQSAGAALADANQKLQIARLSLEKYEKDINGGSGISPEMTAPLTGVIMLRDVEPGTSVGPGQLLFEIGDYKSLYLKAKVLTDDMDKIKLGQAVEIHDGPLGDQRYMGHIYYIAPKAENSLSTLGVEQQRIEVRMKFDQHNVDIKPGYGFESDIITAEKAKTKVIRNNAIIKENDSDFVFVVTEAKAKLVRIHTGLANDDYTEVLSGLNLNDLVILDPPNDLEPNQRVRVLGL